MLQEGNYWGDYDEPIEGAWDNNSDGIADTPYGIPGGGNMDRYPLIYPPGTKTTVKVLPSYQEVYPDESFSINISVTPVELIAGVQLDLSFDPTLLTATGVVESELFREFSTYFDSGTIDNSNGTIIDIYGVIIDAENGTMQPGTFVVVNFTAKTASGLSSLNLSDVIVGSPDGIAVSILVFNGSVSIVMFPDWDINMDGRTNVLDLVVIGQRWGETGPPGWIRADVNDDGVLNVLDIILVGQHWTG
jgi:hypothetical protein